VCDSGVYADSPTELGAFISGTRGVEDDFDGTPGGFSTFNDEAAKGEEEAEVVREAPRARGCRAVPVRE
jgi:hypothetical protein